MRDRSVNADAAPALFLAVTLLDTYGLGAGIRHLMTGFIIAVISR